MAMLLIFADLSNLAIQKTFHLHFKIRPNYCYDKLKSLWLERIISAKQKYHFNETDFTAYSKF